MQPQILKEINVGDGSWWDMRGKRYLETFQKIKKTQIK